MALALQDSTFFHAASSHYIGVDELDLCHGDPASALEHRMRALVWSKNASNRRK